MKSSVASTLAQLAGAIGVVLGSRMLSWHYRSRDPSLIEVSNREFYESALILPPSPLQRDPAYGLCFTKVDGVYDKGGKRDNRKEGEAIVARVAEHARANGSLSLGIVTFSFAQRNLITELLELARRSDSVLDEFLREGKSENLFVKNIENVQGDERDVILISVGYGRQIDRSFVLAKLPKSTTTKALKSIRAKLIAGNPVLLMLWGAYDHCSVAVGITDNRLILFDSGGFRWVKLANVGLYHHRSKRCHQVRKTSVVSLSVRTP